MIRGVMQINRSEKRPTQKKLLPLWHWGIPLALLLGLLLFVTFGPEERTLGGGIRSVYVHVGLIWTGLFGFGVTAVLGIGILLAVKPAWQRWLAIVSWVALGFYAAGIFMSMVASADNWGAVFLQEPRMAASLNGLAVATIFLILGSWQPWPRMRGALSASIIFVLLWLNFRAELVLHPPNPIANSNATPIQLTFLAVTVLFVLWATWLVWFLHRRTG
jgi:hypothetical protein